MVRVLDKVGLNVNYQSNQTDCGKLSFDNGNVEDARQIATKFLEDFPHDRPLIIPSASCAGFIRNYYGKLFHNSSLHIEYKRLIRNTYEFSDFLVNKQNVSNVGSIFEHSVTFHDCCSGLREYGLKDEARKLLGHVRGLELIEMRDSDVCCGYGGTFSLRNEPISTAIGSEKIENALATGAEYITSTDATCLMHLQAIIDKKKLPITTIHLADILASGL